MVNRLGKLMHEWEIPFRAYDRKWLEETTFYGYHKDLLDCPRGNGYWAWKPYIILDAYHYADTVIYMDSSIVPDSADAIREAIAMTKDVGAMETGYVNCAWTKRSCFKNMRCDSQEYWYSKQVWAAVVIAKMSGRHIIDEWFYHCSSYSTISDLHCSDNFPEFQDHRHDQSILTNVLIKYAQPFLVTDKFKDVVKYE